MQKEKRGVWCLLLMFQFSRVLKSLRTAARPGLECPGAESELGTGWFGRCSQNHGIVLGMVKNKVPTISSVDCHKALHCVVASLGQSRTWLQCCDTATPQDGIYSREGHLYEGGKKE